MNVVETAENYLDDLLSEHSRYSGRVPRLFYTVELVDEDAKTRSDYHQRARELQQELTQKLTKSHRFVTVHLDQTIDPYIALAETSPELALSDDDQRVREFAERDRERRPWPTDVGFDIDDLLQGYSDPIAAQEARRNVVAYEVSVQGSADTRDGLGAPAPIQNTRELFAEFVAETDDVESVERWYPFPDDATYGFQHRQYEIRVRTIIKNGWPHVEWEIGPDGDRGRGLGSVGVVGDDEHGLNNGRLYLGDTRNEVAERYIDDEIASVPMPERIAEMLMEDAREGQREAALEREIPDEDPAAESEQPTANGTT